VAPGELGGRALLRGVDALGVGAALRAVALEENGVALVSIGAALVCVRFVLMGAVVPDNHGRPRCRSS
jgi:hypothetical protein